MGKRLLLIGYNFYPEPTGIGKYSGEMIRWLADNGYACTVLTTYPYYPYWKVQEPFVKNRFRYKTQFLEGLNGGSITVHRCPAYIPKNPTGMKRMLLDLSFLFSAFLRLLPLMAGKKRQNIMVVVPSFQFGLLGLIYKWMRGGKLFYHIQDMQIEAARDLGMIRSNRLIRLFFSIERFILRRCNVVSSISENMIARTGEKTGREVVLFPNWTDTRSFFPLQEKALLKEKFGFRPNQRIILYSGAIGQKQGLESILEAAEYFKSRPEICFVICGSGPYKEKLEQLQQSKKLPNVRFLPLQPVEVFNEFLNMADLHLVIQKSTASDLVLPSKLATILSVGGVAVVTAPEGSSLHALVSQNGIGILAEPDQQAALNWAIEQGLEPGSQVISVSARAYAEKHLSIDTILTAYAAHFQ